MAKFVLLAIAVAAALWLLRGRLRRPADEDGAPAAPDAESMVRCARCGVHLPRVESVAAAGRFFCSPQHQREFGEHGPGA
jgi:uncharacterized protein